MPRLYTEIRIFHKTQEEKEAFEEKLKAKYKKEGFSDRAEYVRFVSLNAEIEVKVKE